MYGTWWGLHKASDAHKLVRIKIDIPNSQDNLWGIDIKKSTAKPLPMIKNDLKRILREVVKKGSKPYAGRGKRIHNSTVKRFWDLVPNDGGIRFALSLDHPVYKELIPLLDNHSKELLKFYLSGVEAYLPLEAIQSNLHDRPHQIKQEDALSDKDIEDLAKNLMGLGLDENKIAALLKTEVFKGREDLLGVAHE